MIGVAGDIPNDGLDVFDKDVKPIAQFPNIITALHVETFGQVAFALRGIL